jgi:hypothetical protein
MRFDDFVKALMAAGWRPSLDAQHSEIRRMWETLWPVLAQVEKELFNAECRIDDLTS